jgi:septum formation topological specificity factor MinE
MVSQTRPLWLLLLIIAVAFAQEEPAEGGEPAADTRDAAGEGEEKCEECEEAWEYVEFLKVEINEKVTETLQDFKTSGGADQTVSQTMEQVMEIREAILERIKGIRKEEGVTICPDQNIKQEEKLSEFRMEIMSILLKLVDSTASDNLKEISGQLLKFRSAISTEVMRLLMLPQPTCGEKKKVPQGDCDDCQVLSELAFTLKDLQICATKKDDEEEGGDGEGETPEEQPAAETKEGEAAEPGENCVEPIMYAMTLILANEKLDKAIAGLYSDIIQATEEDERAKFYDMLTSLKSFREKIDEVITKLMELGDDKAKLKKEVSRNLRVLIIEVTTKLDECNADCGESGNCKSCAGPVLNDAIDKMAEYTEFMESDREDEEKKDYIRGDLITHINKINDDSRNILVLKVESGELDQCEKDKLEVYNRIKGPMWMLVNFTIFGEMTEVQQMVLVMDDELKTLLGKYCANTIIDIPDDSEEGPNCEWEEYEKTKEYLVEVDNTIQEGLFKAKTDADKTTALLGFVKIQEMFDKRVKKLFEDQVQCPDELQMIKKEYMDLLNKCMIEFMNPKVKFSEMTRLQRISCIKGLRNSMEDRTAKLLQFELEKSLSGIEEGN